MPRVPDSLGREIVGGVGQTSASSFKKQLKKQNKFVVI